MEPSNATCPYCQHHIILRDADIQTNDVQQRMQELKHLGETKKAARHKNIDPSQ